MDTISPKLIFFTGVYDTLDIFTYELIPAFEQMGYETLEIHTNQMQQGLFELAKFVETPVVAAITFNNLGFNLELVQGKNIWEELGIPCINILMDHPFCYRDSLEQAPANSIVLCVDKKHMEYLQRFFPNIPVAGFLPHGGKRLERDPLPIVEREIDVMYAGGLSRKFIDNVMPDFEQFQDFDARQIAGEAYERLINETEITAEYAIEQALLAHGVYLSEESLSYTISQLHYVELLATSYYREKLIRTMLDNGIRVHLYGPGWEICDFADHENLVWEGRISAEEVLDRMHHSKIVLNTMTWFKDGIHDRVLNGMLAGAVAVTDTSLYMEEEFCSLSPEHQEDANLLLFRLQDMDRLAGQVKDLLAQPELMQQIADRGRRLAVEHHTWQCRARELHQELLQPLMDELE